MSFSSDMVIYAFILWFFLVLPNKMSDKNMSKNG